MADVLTKDQRHRNMAAIHSASTKPELKLRHALWNLGFRYRVNDKRLPGKPDIVLPKYRTVIFVHGCFWHGHKNCLGYAVPKTNTEFWIEKIKRNQERDQETWRLLEAKGWYVIVVWECELNKKCLDNTISTVANQIRFNGCTYHGIQEERKAARAQYKEDLRNKKERTQQIVSELDKVFPH